MIVVHLSDGTHVVDWDAMDTEVVHPATLNIFDVTGDMLRLHDGRTTFGAVPNDTVVLWHLNPCSMQSNDCPSTNAGE